MSLLKFSKGLAEVKMFHTKAHEGFVMADTILEFYVGLEDHNKVIPLNKVEKIECYCGCENHLSVQPDCVEHSLDYDTGPTLIAPTYILHTTQGKLRMPKNMLQVADLHSVCGSDVNQIKDGEFGIRVVSGLNRAFKHLYAPTEQDKMNNRELISSVNSRFNARLHVEFVRI